MAARRRSTKRSTTQAGIQPLATFRATTGTLTPMQRATLVAQAELLLDELYVHLPLKQAMHACDPLQRLRLLATRLEGMSERQFHDELLDIFTDLRDLHTNYVLPSPYAGRVAFLPFLVEDYWQGGERRYLVTKMQAGFSHPEFRPGVTVTSWSGIPFDRAVELNADRQAGSNPDARRARGLESLTLRSLALSPMPDEDWVLVGYTDTGGTDREIRLDWQVFTPSPSPNGVDMTDPFSPAAQRMAVDARFEQVRRAKKALFNEAAMAAEHATATATGRRRAAAADDATTMPDVFSFREITAPGGPYGYIRIWTFSVDDDVTFVDEFVRLAGLLPANGLVVDVRGNGGGLITAAERLLQVLTPRTVEPSRLSLRSTPATLDLVRSQPWLALWEPSLARSVETGELYSQALPLLDPSDYNDLGQQYQGPVVLVTDSLCYSATDIFSAGFQDNGIGKILGTGATGAGGANVWDYGLLRQLDPELFSTLPKGASYRVSARRITRAGDNAGVPLEDLGVVPDVTHRTTKKDLLDGNADLLKAACAILKGEPRRSLSAVVERRTATGATLAVTSSGIDRVDVWVDDRPRATADVPGSGGTSVPVPVPVGEVRLEGFDSGELAVVAHLSL
jgi:hypothetical protein